MAEETNGVRITQRDIYEKLVEVQAVQIEIVADIRNLPHLDLVSQVSLRLSGHYYDETPIF
jgi:hypothetical protein